MRKQTFVVILEIPSPLDRYFPKVEAERLASIIRDGVEAKSVSFMGPVPFRICVERTDETASASGKVRAYSAEEFEEAEETLREPAKALEEVQAK
jgi:hypothetical protein